MSLEIVILSAGKGKRMHSDLPKVLHKVAGKRYQVLLRSIPACTFVCLNLQEAVNLVPSGSFAMPRFALHKTHLKLLEKKECAFAVHPTLHGSMPAASLARVLLLRQILFAGERNSLPASKRSESTS